MSMNEVRTQVNITIDFMVQLPLSEKDMFQNFNLRMYEDLSAYKARIKIVHTKMITDHTMNMII